MKWIGISVLFLLPMAAHADEEMQLKVRPVLCVVDDRAPACEMSFVIHWQSAETGFYCLYNDLVPAPLRCWEEQRSGEHNDERKVETGFRYWMAQSDAAAPLAVVMVEVLRIHNDDRRRKRRSRHVWDIID